MAEPGPSEPALGLNNTITVALSVSQDVCEGEFRLGLTSDSLQPTGAVTSSVPTRARRYLYSNGNLISTNTITLSSSGTNTDTFTAVRGASYKVVYVADRGEYNLEVPADISYVSGKELGVASVTFTASGNETFNATIRSVMAYICIGTDVSKSVTCTLHNVPTKFNAVTKEGSSPADLTFTSASGELCIPIFTTNEDSAVLNTDIKVTQNNKLFYARTLNSVPMKRNYLTDIYNLNALKQQPYYDLSTSSKWSSLSSGTHQVTIVAKGTGYRDSEPSAGVKVIKPTVAYTDCITFTGESSEFTLSVDADNGAKEWDGTVWYSTDHNTWTVWDGAAISSVNKKLYLRGKNNTKFYTELGAYLSLSARAGCSGNINTLLDYENPPMIIPTTDCYTYMFSGCINLISAPELPATTLAPDCYSHMFSDCGLINAPELPATTLADRCYNAMFSGCPLTKCPELPATTLAPSCYMFIFAGCTSLTIAPKLPVTTLTSGCYSAMFQGCNSLTVAPELPATTLTSDCYNSMFRDCTSLTTAPELPATTLITDCYYSMFRGCTKLKVNTSSGDKIFTCPSYIPYRAVDRMFAETGGTFTGTPTAGNTYYWYQ